MEEDVVLEAPALNHYATWISGDDDARSYPDYSKAKKNKRWTDSQWNKIQAKRAARVGKATSIWNRLNQAGIEGPPNLKIFYGKLRTHKRGNSKMGIQKGGQYFRTKYMYHRIPNYIEC